LRAINCFSLKRKTGVVRHARAVTRWLERSIVFRSWGSVASSGFVTLLGGVHLILANPPWRQLQERAEKIPGDKKHVKGMLSQSHCVAQFNTAQIAQARSFPLFV
jgi:hypothetical protein